ncbi:MAG: L-aspartate oxidase [Candidatus Riflebacteria bacterium]|nr:L-aspartate oxidase [Candidatus Riflebacteria bacterium]
MKSKIEWKSPAVIVGMGIAGLFAALRFARDGEVLVLGKGRLEDSNSLHAQGGIAVVWDPEDHIAFHFEDTLIAGAGLCDPEAVQILVEEGPFRVSDLISLGMEFDHSGQQLCLTREGAHSHPRILHAGGDSTGRKMVQTLAERVREEPRIRVVEDFLASDLMVENGRILGITGWAKDLTPIRIFSPRILLATGGVAGIFPETTNPIGATGDGIVMAWDAGAVLADMEFIQFHPTVLTLPNQPRFLISEAVRGEGAHLVDDEGKRFMSDHHPQGELAPRDIVSRGILSQMRKKLSQSVFLDARHLGAEFLKNRFPAIEAHLNKLDLSLGKDLIPVSPAAHYTMGGILTDLNGKTTIEGLFAAGECASAGIHGANRLASNSLLESLVFSFRAAESMLEKSSSTETNSDYKGHSWELPDESEIEVVQRQISENLGPLRNTEGLKFMCDTFRPKLEKKYRLPPFTLLPDTLAQRNFNALTGIISIFAENRKESRGAHYRIDFSKPDPTWLFRQTLTGLQLGRIEIER